MRKTATSRTALLLYPKRFWVLASGVLLLSAVFWTTSRYPHLIHMAEASGGFSPTSLVAVEPILSIAPEASYLNKVILNTGNWLYANRIGMSFGLLFGALALTLLRTLDRPRSTNTYLNTVYGVALGAPLGVCVNCAAPIAAGVLRGGSALSTSLSTMFSSPTLNVIALVMAFSILPVQIVLIKLGLSLFFLLIVLPWIASRFQDAPAPGAQTVASNDNDAACAISALGQSTWEPWRVAMRGTGSALLANAWYLVRLTVPLMIAAGFLGAVITSAIPVSELSSFEVNAAGMLVVVFVGLLLPMPIAFDVMLSQALYAAGLPLPYVACLLFTLGIHSVFSFAVVSRMHSLRLASAIGSVLMIFGLASGGLAIVLAN